MPDSTYCIDTSALIHLKRLYPIDVFPGLWNQLGRLVRSGRLIAPFEVLKELEKKDDVLLRWARRHRRMFKKLDAAQIEKVKEIARAFPALFDPEKETPDADPFVVALAMVQNESKKDDLFPQQYIVVTQESAEAGRRRIPAACRHYGLECIAVLELFRRENWKFQP